MSRERNWKRYVLRNRNKIVYFGITSREYPESRLQQHVDDGKGFTSSEVLSPVVTEGGAKKWEKERIEGYRRSHRGKAPRYNKV